MTRTKFLFILSPDKNNWSSSSSSSSSL